MKTSHLAIEVLPRLLWVVEIATLFGVYYYLGYDPVLTPNKLLLVIGVFFLVAGLAGIVWTIRFIAKAMFNKSLVTGGPYRCARHPMYVAIHLALVGVGLLFYNVPWLIMMLLFLPLWIVDCKLEEWQMTELHGKKYREYQATVGMFMPKSLSPSTQTTAWILTGLITFVIVTAISGYLRIFEWGWPLVFQEIYFESPGTPQPEPVWINLLLDLAFWLAVSYGIIWAISVSTKK